MEQDVEGGGGISIPGSVQEKGRYIDMVVGVVGTVGLGGLSGIFLPEGFCDSMNFYQCRD